MTSMLVKAGLAALVALTGLSSVAPSAAAREPGFGIYVQYHDRDRGWRDDHRGWRDDHRGWRDDHRRWRPDHRRRGCAPWLAEAKADRMGLRRTRVVDVSRRTVTVVGYDRRGRDRVVFANVRGCPLIRR